MIREAAAVVLTRGGSKAFSAGGDIVGMLKHIEAADHASWINSMGEALPAHFGPRMTE